MGIRSALGIACALALVFAAPAFADDATTPPAIAAMPDDAPPAPVETPPAPPSEVTPLNAPPAVDETPMYPTDQPGRARPPGAYPPEPSIKVPCPPPPPPPCPPTVREFEATVRAVETRVCPPPCPPPCPQPCPPPCLPCDPCNPPPRDPCAPCAPANNCFWGYGGVAFKAFPGLGAGVEFGGYINGPSCATWSWEVNLNYEDMTDDFNGIQTGEGGKWISARGGVKASFLPRAWHHPVLRAGLGWGVESGDADNNFDIGSIPQKDQGQTNFFGFYGGIGWEFDVEILCNCFQTGPEIMIFAGISEEGGDWAYTPSFMWHFIWQF